MTQTYILYRFLKHICNHVQIIVIFNLHRKQKEKKTNEKRERDNTLFFFFFCFCYFSLLLIVTFHLFYGFNL